MLTPCRLCRPVILRLNLRPVSCCTGCGPMVHDMPGGMAINTYFSGRMVPVVACRLLWSWFCLNSHGPRRLIVPAAANNPKNLCFMAKFESFVERVPSWALPYLVNGDASGLEESEIKMIDAWRELSHYEIISPRDEAEYFSSVPAFGLACDVLDCDCLVRK